MVYQMITADSKFEKLILRFFRITVVLFSSLAILEVSIVRHLDFMDDYLGDRKKIISTFKQNNFIFLVGFYDEVSNGEHYSSLNYLLIPKTISLPAILYIQRYPDGSVEYESGDNLQAIIVIMLLSYGFYIIGCYVKSVLSKKAVNQGVVLDDNDDKR